MHGLRIAAVVLLLASPAVAADNPGSEVFHTKGKCTACHGEDGSGQTPAGKALKAADLRSDAVQKKSDEELIASVTNGRGKMPSFKSSLTPQQIHDAIAYVRALAKK